MEETKTMTVKEILTDVCRMLRNIDVPATKIEQIGIPIARSINGIELCLEAIEQEEKVKKEEHDKIEITNFQVVNEEPSDAEPIQSM